MVLSDEECIHEFQHGTAPNPDGTTTFEIFYKCYPVCKIIEDTYTYTYGRVRVQSQTTVVSECPNQHVCSKWIPEMTSRPDGRQIRAFECQLWSAYVQAVGVHTLGWLEVPCKVKDPRTQRVSDIRQCRAGEYCGVKGAQGHGFVGARAQPKSTYLPIDCVSMVQIAKQTDWFRQNCYPDNNGQFPRKCCGMSFQNQNSPMKFFNEFQCNSNQVCSLTMKRPEVITPNWYLRGRGLHENVYIFIHFCVPRTPSGQVPVPIPAPAPLVPTRGLSDIINNHNFIVRCNVTPHRCCGISYPNHGQQITIFAGSQYPHYTCMAPNQRCSRTNKECISINSRGLRSVFVHYCVSMSQPSYGYQQQTCN